MKYSMIDVLEKAVKPIILLILLSLIASVVFAQPCLSGFGYRVPIFVDNTNNAANLNAYQVRISLNTQSLIAAGKLQASAGDLRFTDQAGNVLPHYVEPENLNTAATNVWVRMNLAGNGSATIYLFYGNPTANNIADGNAVFELFDDFNGNALNTGKWAFCGGGSASINNGAVTLTSSAPANQATLRSLNNFNFNSIVDAKVNSVGEGIAYIGLANPVSEGYGLQFEEIAGVPAFFMTRFDGTNCFTTNALPAPQNSTTLGLITAGNWSFQWTSATDQQYGTPIDPVVPRNANILAYTAGVTQVHAVLGNNSKNSSFTVDRVWVRKHTINPPTPTLQAETALSANITASSNSPVCQGGSLQLSATSFSGASYTWTGPDGFNSNLQNPNILNVSTAKSGNYNVSVGGIPGCAAQVASVAVTINPTPVAGTLNGATTVCSGTNNGTLSLTGYTGNVIRWESAPSGTGPWSSINETADQLTFQNLTSTTFFRAIVGSGACPPVASNTVQIQVDQPSVSGVITGQETACSGGHLFNLSLNNAVGNVLRWRSSTDGSNFNDIANNTLTQQVQNLTQTTFYTAEVKNGVCPSVFAPVKSVVINPLPALSFNPSGLCEDDTTFFALNSSISTGSISAFEWQFGDGNSSATPNARNVYLNAGSYNVTVSAVSNAGCRNSATQAIVINPAPTASFSVQTHCFGNALPLTNNSSVGSGTLSFNWNFGDANSSNLASPSHTYNAAGQYTVNLSVQSNAGCSASTANQVVVAENPIADFNVTNSCENDNINLTNNSLVSNTNSTFTWDFGNGTPRITQQLPSFSYFDPGNFNIKLIVTSDAGCQDSTTKPITINPYPVIDFTVNDVCLGDSVKPTNLTTISSGTVNYFWGNIGSVLSTQENPSLFFSQPGEYFLTLGAFSDQGCGYQTFKTARVLDNPTAQFSISDHCQGTAAPISNNSSINLGALTYNWQFGEGSSSNQASPNFTYANSGNYQVKLIATSPQGCQDSLSNSVEVFAPTVSGNISGADTLCASKASGQLELQGQTGDIVQWEFAILNQADFAPINHTLAQYQYNNLSQSTAYRALVQSGNCNAIYTDSVIIRVDALSDAGSINGADTICQNANSGTLHLEKFTGNVQKWLQLVGANAISDVANLTSQQPFTNLSQTTAYAAVVKNGVCSADTSAFVTLVVSPTTVAGVLSGADTLCQGGNTASLSIQGNVGTVLSWESAVNGNQPWTTINHQQTQLQLDSVQQTTVLRALVKSGACNAVYTNPQTIKIDESSSAGDLLGAQTVCADVNQGSLQSLNVVGQVLRWESTTDFLNWNVINNTFNSLNFNDLTTTTYYKLITQNGVCPPATSDTIAVTVVNRPVADFDADSVCEGAATSFSNTGTAGSNVVYQWAFSDGGSSSTNQPSHQFAQAGVYPVSLIVSNAANCKDSITQNVLVKVNPTAAFTLLDVCFPDTSKAISSSFAGSGSALTLQRWNFDNGASTSLGANAQYAFGAAGNYAVQLTVVNDLGCSDSLSVMHEVFEQPNADFIADSVCLGQAAQPINTSSISNGNLTYVWKWNNATTSNLAQPQVQYANPGDYLVTLIANSPNQCADSSFGTIRVFEQPTAHFSFTNVCLGDSMPFVNLSNGNALTYHWNFDNGNTSSSANPKLLYAQSGNYNVLLEVVNADACSSNVVQTVEVFENPAVDFSTQDICFGSPTPIANLSTLNFGSLQYDWNFGDGNSSTLGQPNHTYSQDGTYQITLVGTTSNGCMDSLHRSITVFASSQAGQIIGADTVCSDQNSGTILAVNSTGNVLYWESKSTAQTQWTSLNQYDTLIQYQQLGSTTQFRPIVQNGVCQADTGAAVTIQVDLASDAGIIASGMPLCIDSNEVNLTLNAVSGALVNWIASTDTAKNWLPLPIISDTLIRNQLLTSTHFAVVVKNGVCENDTSNFAFYPISQSVIPGVLIGADTVCVNGNGGQLRLTNYQGDISHWEQQNSASSAWINLNKTTDSLVYQQLPASTTYRVKVSNGACGEAYSNSVEIAVDSSAQAGILLGANTVCDGVNNGQLELTAYQGQIVRWQQSSDNITWNDTLITTALLPYQNLTQSTYYRAVVDNGVCNEAISNVVLVAVRPRPVVNFGSDTVCLTDATTFTDSSSISSGGIIQRFWQFGDGNGSVVPSPVHTYNQSGSYIVKLLATSAFGCTDSVSKTVIVRPRPSAQFVASDLCLNDSLSFVNATAISPATPLQYTWNFGDNSPLDTMANPTYQWATAGNFGVQLIATTSFGCADSMQQNVVVYPHPIAAFIADTVFEGQLTNFTNTSSIAPGNSLSFNWVFGNGQGSTVQTPQVNYSTFGTYTVQLTAVSQQGCSNSVTDTVLVLEQPVADFSFSDVCIHDSAFFTNNSVYSSGNAQYVWQLGNNQSDSSFNTALKYLLPGTYNVTLNLYADNGGFDQVSKQITIYPKPVVSFTQADVCDTISVVFQNLSTISNGTMTYLWHFGDGQTSTQISPKYRYALPGTYEPTLVATSNFGCVDSLTKVQTVHFRPTADFEVAAICDGFTSEFIDSSKVLSNELNAYVWDFGDGRTAVVPNPTHRYLNPGVYNVNLTITTDNNCRSSITKQATVYETPVADFEVSNVCFNQETRFTNRSFYSGSALAYQWDLGNGMSSTAAVPDLVYPEFGNYQVKLLLTSPNGCQDSTSALARVFPLPTILPQAELNEVSKGFPVQLTATGAAIYEWSPAEILNNNLIQSPVARPVEPTTFLVTAIDSNGCINDTTLFVDVVDDYKVIATNVLTPDGNGLNDFWIVENIENYGDCSLSIYNRWGKLIYQTTAYQNDWNGVNQAGEILPDGAYFYVISFSGNSQTYKGAITIMRNQ